MKGFPLYSLSRMSVAKLLWTKVFNESANNSGLQSMYFFSLKNAFITSEIPMAFVDIYDLALVILCFRKDTRIFE